MHNNDIKSHKWGKKFCSHNSEIEFEIADLKNCNFEIQSPKSEFGD